MFLAPHRSFQGITTERARAGVVGGATGGREGAGGEAAQEARGQLVGVASRVLGGGADAGQGGGIGEVDLEPARVGARRDRPQVLARCSLGGGTPSVLAGPGRTRFGSPPAPGPAE
ncbi:hypothetical protein [Nannocystis pusilla]|uniref:hypothetical protein n=1 Tax=Nannocystis pusilla TaxID=889268 RepID=UPI003B7FF160